MDQSTTETDRASIYLVDNTSPPEQRHRQDGNNGDGSTNPSLSRHSSSKRWSRPSVRGELAKRKYAKWQPHRLGLDDASGPGSGLSSDDDEERKRQVSDARRSSGAFSFTGGDAAPSLSKSPSRVVDFASDGEGGAAANSSSASANGTTTGTGDNAPQPQRNAAPKTTSELDVLYENQRGWFLFGIPLYSHSSLLNFDPSAWVTREMHDSPVNITNAQLPDPSWQWVWKSWYVDMSGDVDEQGWQYSYSFSSSAWHGTHPWFHSFVRRRRWVRLRTKLLSIDRVYRGLTGLEEAHMFTADYFTIHSRQRKRGTNTSETASRVPSTYLMDPANQTVDEEPYIFEEIGNIPTLMYALKMAIVDREKIDALKRFIEEGGDEIYYLDERVFITSFRSLSVIIRANALQIPEIMSIFVFQTSRWQFLTHLIDVIDSISQKISSSSGKESVELRRKQENLVQAAESVRRNITGPELVADHDQQSSSAAGMLDLTPVSKRESLLSNKSSKAVLNDRPVDNGGDIKGIPKEAEIGREGHIYRFSS